MRYQYYLILIYSISYLLFFVLLWISKEKQGLRLFSEKGFVFNRQLLIILHLGGIILFGIIPILSNFPYPFVFFDKGIAVNPATWITLLSIILLLFISHRLAGKKYRDFQNNKPVNRTPGNKFILAYFFIRIIFICAYETWFRGYLLNDCIAAFGEFWAILLNIFLYALLHIVNGREEVIACIPFGLLLCLVCIWEGAAWPAIFIHLALTVPYETSFLKKIRANQLLTNENFNNGSFRISRE